MGEEEGGRVGKTPTMSSEFARAKTERRTTLLKRGWMGGRIERHLAFAGVL